MVLETAIKRQRAKRWERPTAAAAMQLTPRDEEIVRTVWRLRFVTCDQVNDLFFTEGARSNCQRRLTLLFQNGYLAKLCRAVNEPDVYFLGREAREGLKLLRSRTTSQDLVRRTRSFVQLEHVLAINDVRCRVTRASREIGQEVIDWRDQAELVQPLRSARLVPDGYFVLQKRFEDRSAIAAFMLEVERSPRGPRALLQKYGRLREFYESGAYQRLFERRSLRLLVLTSSVSKEAESVWAGRLSSLAEKVGLTFARFSSQREFLSIRPNMMLESAIWHRPGRPERIALGKLA